MTALVLACALAAGAAGALLRYGVAHVYRNSPARLPVAVLIVNIFGSLLAGVFVGMSSLDPTGALRMIAVSGFAGGLSTFSTFSVETVQLALAGRWRAATGSVAANVVGGCGAFALAYACTMLFVVTAR